jgi:hypothetical protein
MRAGNGAAREQEPGRRAERWAFPLLQLGDPAFPTAA